MSRHRIILITLITCVFVLRATTACAEKIVVYAGEAYAPVIYMEQGKAKGILPEIFARLSKDTGDTYEIILVPWKRALQESTLGKGGITNFSFTKERARLFDFSDSIYNDDLQLVTLKGREFSFKEIKDLKDKIIGGAAGASFGDEIDQAISDGLFIMERDPHQRSRLLKLLRGRMDAAIVANGTDNLERLLSSDPELKANKSKFIVLSRPLTSDSLHLAFLKSMNMKPALARFNKSLGELKKTKEYKQILQRQDISK